VFDARGTIFQEIDSGILLRAVLVLLPLLLLAAASGDAIWLRAAIVTLSTFIAFERSGLAPIGVLLHGFAILVCFSMLLLALQSPVIFVCGCAILAGSAIAMTARGAKLRSLGNFTFIPAVYLACEIGESLPPRDLLARCLHFLPFAAAAVVPSLILSVFASQSGAGFFRVMRKTDLGKKLPWKEPVLAVTFAVALAAGLVEWRHLGNGQWVIWSAASVVTGNAGTAGAKLGNRAIGALIGVPAGIGIGQFLPHGAFAFELAVLASFLTIVAFKRYIIGFGARCMLIASAFMIAGETASVAAERVSNVILGGVIGVVCVFGFHAIAARQAGRVEPH
jgi:hypothetical protein